MLDSIYIKNYKSIKEIDVEVGKFNVLIGENGAGKSNFLESLASYSAVIANNFSNEFMLSRGIRVVESNDIFSCFKGKLEDEIVIITSDSNRYVCSIEITIDKSEPFSPFKHEFKIFHPGVNKKEESKKDIEVLNIKELNENFFKDKIKEISTKEFGSMENLKSILEQTIETIKSSSKDNLKPIEDTKRIKKIARYITTLSEIKREIFVPYKNSESHINKNFIIYSPELSSLRIFSSESQIEPLGVNGEGLLKLLQLMQEHEPENFKKVCETIEVFQWVEKITIQTEPNNLEQRIKIVDRFMGKEIDHRSANEGFLFVLFYAALFCSKFTPKCFAVDNIDASLNPQLCRVLIKELVKLAKENEKQAFVTTHNPAILDGLDLHDEEQKLFVVERDDKGATQLRHVGVDDLPKPKRNGQTIKLSEAFMRGHLGGLPTNF
ncbi:AAA family ATPase [Acinetobacter calcoaceticus]|uniref:AAA family ATPase n=1 Tax=Acinetobacter calcoaceticus TaxID=471 RepID=UPI001AE7D13A|nr:AAA family ATPase [Acinetobacter calcoaceticus]MBP2605546.1 putative ATPase [Acinetobacter calcoaceticus]